MGIGLPSEKWEGGGHLRTKTATAATTRLGKERGSKEETEGQEGASERGAQFSARARKLRGRNLS